jgi:glutathione S-transferase
MTEPQDRRGTLRFVDLETARAARGLRLVLITALPSPWSEGARALFAVKGLDALAVRFVVDDAAMAAWTGVPNAPAVMLDDEPPRSGWAEIISLGERLSPTPALVPSDPDARVLMFGLLHEILGEGGLAWSRRLLILHESLRPDDARRPRYGFPRARAELLARRYGYAPPLAARARARIIESLGVLDASLERSRAAGGRYFLGDEMTALDLYGAAAMAAVVPPADAVRPILPLLRPALEHLDAEIGAAVTPALLAHRDLMYANHLREAPPPAAAPRGPAP